MAEDTRYTAKTGMVTISTANTGLDGTGTLGTIITGGSNGTLIKTLKIQAIVNTTAGAVRIFISGGGSISLLMEIEVPAITKAGINPAFEQLVELNFNLQSGYMLKAAPQNAESFNVIAEGLDWAYSTPVSLDRTQYTTNYGFAQISTANTNLDGTGTTVLAYTAGTSATYNGSSLSSIIIKGTKTTKPGMVRLFISDGTTKYLFTEVFVPSVAASATDQAFEQTIAFENNYELQAKYFIYAATETAQSYNVAINGNDWNYAP